MGRTRAVADNVRFTGDAITAFAWPRWNTVELKGGSGVGGRVRHVEMHMEG